MILKGLKISVLLFFFLISIVAVNGNESASGSVQEHSKGKFDTKEVILKHIADAYEWHMFTLGSFHANIPLPIIVYSKTTGIHLFLSSKLKLGNGEYENFKIAEDGTKYAGKIVEIVPGGELIRPFDFSITKNVTSLMISFVFLLFILISVAKKYEKSRLKAPKGVQGILEPIILFVRDDIAKASIGPEKFERFVPFLLTLFFFILINNLLGLVPFFPGGANLSGNISFTLVLALFTFVITNVNGSKSYWIHMVNAPGVPWWLKFPIPLMPIVEIMGIFLKPFVLTLRLFANMTAGHIIALSFYCLIFIFGEKNIFIGYTISIVSIAFTLFMGLLEILVSFIQAYVFTLLSALYFGLSMENHAEDHSS